MINTYVNENGSAAVSERQRANRQHLVRPRSYGGFFEDVIA